MYLDNENFEKIAAKFGNKWKCVEYCGCWSNATVTFVLWQDETESAGFEVTILKPCGNHLGRINVNSVKRLSKYSYNEKSKRYETTILPILIP